MGPKKKKQVSKKQVVSPVQEESARNKRVVRRQLEPDPKHQETSSKPHKFKDYTHTSSDSEESLSSIHQNKSTEVSQHKYGSVDESESSDDEKIIDSDSSEQKTVTKHVDLQNNKQEREFHKVGEK